MCNSGNATRHKARSFGNVIRTNAGSYCEACGRVLDDAEEFVSVCPSCNTTLNWLGAVVNGNTRKGALDGSVPQH